MSAKVFRQGWFRSPRSRVVVAGLVVALAGGVWLGARAWWPRQQEVFNYEHWGLGLPASVGVDFGFGMAVAYNRGHNSVVLERIRLVDLTPGVDVVGTAIGGRKRRVTLGGSSEWPSKDFRDLHPVAEYRLAPIGTDAGDPGAQLVFHLYPRKVGVFTARGVQVDYRVGRRHRRALLHHYLRVCVMSTRRHGDSCRAPHPD